VNEDGIALIKMPPMTCGADHELQEVSAKAVSSRGSEVVPYEKISLAYY